MKKSNAWALLPIGVFVILYLSLGIIFEYVMKIPMGFYNIPIVVVFVIALLVACLQNRSLRFDDKLEVMAKGVGDKDIMTMILIFLVSGIFVGVTGRSSAEAVAYFLLSVTPAWAAVAVLFIAANTDARKRLIPNKLVLIGLVLRVVFWVIELITVPDEFLISMRP